MSVFDPFSLLPKKGMLYIFRNKVIYWPGGSDTLSRSVPSNDDSHPSRHMLFALKWSTTAPVDRQDQAFDSVLGLPTVTPMGEVVHFNPHVLTPEELDRNLKGNVQDNPPNTATREYCCGNTMC